MAVEVKKRIINGSEYACYTLNASDALRLIPKLLKYLGFAMAAFINRKENPTEAIKDLISTVGEKLDNEEFYSIFIRLVMGCGRDSQKLTDFDMDFTGKLQEALEVFGFVLESNFDFFSKLLDMAPPEEKTEKDKHQAKKKQ